MAGNGLARAARPWYGMTVYRVFQDQLLLLYSVDKILTNIERTRWREGLAHINVKIYIDTGISTYYTCTHNKHTYQSCPLVTPTKGQKMLEILCQMQLGERKIPIVGVSHSMRESWQFCMYTMNTKSLEK